MTLFGKKSHEKGNKLKTFQWFVSFCSVYISYIGKFLNKNFLSNKFVTITIPR